MSGEDILAEARTWRGTKWHHAARLRGVGVDCYGLVFGTALGLGLAVTDFVHYPAGGDNIVPLLRELGRFCRLRDPGEAWQGGDVLVFRSKGLLSHCGFLGGSLPDWTLLHADQCAGFVVEHPLPEKWRDRVHAVYTFL